MQFNEFDDKHEDSEYDKDINLDQKVNHVN